MSKGRVTVVDIASAAGVSKSTVSLVLQGSPLVNEMTRAKVNAVIRDLGYVYNRAAANLRQTASSRIVGIVVNDLTNSFFAELAVGVDQVVQSAGYVQFLANTAEQEQTLRENHQVQRACGADVVLWGQEDLHRAFPHLNVDDIRLASYGQSGEGWFSNTGLMNGFKAKARELGVDYIADEVVAISRAGDRVTGVTLKSGASVQAGAVVNASGPRAALTARMAGLDVPVEPRKRTIFVFDCARTPEGSATVNGGRLPLMIDPSGVFCRPEGRFFLSGAPPLEDPAVDWDDFEPRWTEFEDQVWPTLAERAPAFEAIKVVNQWAGHYDFNSLDHNLIVGRHPQVTNFIFANGFSGHGLQQGPAAGRGVAELLIYGAYRSLDLSEVGYERIREGRPFLEKAVI